MTDHTGNTDSPCRWCGDYHGPQLACDQDGLRREIRRLQSRLAEITDAHRVVMEEKCHEDERHCACVPVLRREAERLQAENAGLLADVEFLRIQPAEDAFETLADLKAEIRHLRNTNRIQSMWLDRWKFIAKKLAVKAGGDDE